MTTAYATMSERLLDLEDIIRPIAIEETRRYLDSRNLVTKDYLDDRIKDVKEHFDERFKQVDLKLEYGFKDVKKSALIQTGFVVAGAVTLILSIVHATSSITAAIQANQAKPAVTLVEAPSSQTR